MALFIRSPKTGKIKVMFKKFDLWWPLVQVGINWEGICRSILLEFIHHDRDIGFFGVFVLQIVQLILVYFYICKYHQIKTFKIIVLLIGE